MNVGAFGMVATALLGCAEDDQLSGDELELLNTVVQAHVDGTELPKEKIGQAVAVMHRYSHLLDDGMQILLKSLTEKR